MTTTLDRSLENLSKITTLVDLLRQRAIHQPDFVGYTFLENGETQLGSLTYQELDQKARAIAAYLQSLCPPSERALLLYPPGLEFIVAFFGCLYAGVVAVPAYPPKRNQKMFRLQAIVNDSQATVVLTTTSVLAEAESRLTQDSELARLCWLVTDNITSNQASDWQEPAVSSRTLAFLQYTSGSTGVPKGVMVTHANVLHNERIIEMAFGHTQKTIVVGWLPLFHDMGLIGNMLQPMHLGIPCVLMSPVAFLQKPLRWLEAISHYKATTSGGPNFAYDMCVRKITPEQRESLDLSSWEVAFNGAEVVRAETLERFAQTFAPCGFRREAFHPCYGMAETTLLVSGGLKMAPPVLYQVKGKALEQNQVVANTCGLEGTRTIVGCGQVWLNQKIVIVDPESLTQCPSSKVGEIWTSSSSVAQGYWNRVEETNHTFNAYLADTGEGPFLRTGDLGFLCNGELFVTGRLKDLIIIRGRNHYPQDIELTVEQSYPLLRSGCSAAFSTNVAGEERLVVAVEVDRSYVAKRRGQKSSNREDGIELPQLFNQSQIDLETGLNPNVHKSLDNKETAIGAIRQAVAEHHELQLYAVLLLKPGSIPKTSSGKIQRHACRAGFLAGSLDLVEDWAENPQHKVELRHLLAEVESLKQQVQAPKQLQSFSGINNLNELARSHNQFQTEETIQAWFVSQLSEHLKIESDDIDIKQPFARYGIDSSVAIIITADLGTWLGLKLEATLLWDYPSIETLAQHLASECILLQSVSKVST